MAVTKLNPADPLFQSPMATLLPSLGSLETLANLKTFIFARYEKIDALRQLAVSRGERVSESTQAELDMLLEVLDWLKMSPLKEQA
jgi:hypothetical protein